MEFQQIQNVVVMNLVKWQLSESAGLFLSETLSLL